MLSSTPEVTQEPGGWSERADTAAQRASLGTARKHSRSRTAPGRLKRRCSRLSPVPEPFLEHTENLAFLKSPKQIPYGKVLKL